jgi:predicted membrane channel-forming protein YqfA (hemolysin III family)
MMSAVYHTFNCHSRNVSEKCLSLDIAGITLSFLATYISGIYFMFFCLPDWRDFHLITVCGIFALAATIQGGIHQHYQLFCQVRNIRG